MALGLCMPLFAKLSSVQKDALLFHENGNSERRFSPRLMCEQRRTISGGSHGNSLFFWGRVVGKRLFSYKYTTCG